DDQHRPDPVVAHLAQGFDDHVAGTNMDQGATLLGQSVFDCVHRVPPKWYALKVRAGSFSSEHNLAHYIAYAAAGLSNSEANFAAVRRDANRTLMAQSGHHATEFQCPLLGVKRTSAQGR